MFDLQGGGGGGGELKPTGLRALVPVTLPTVLYLFARIGQSKAFKGKIYGDVGSQCLHGVVKMLLN